jgi:hypothetical protein
MVHHPTLDKLQALRLHGMYHARVEQKQRPESAPSALQNASGASSIVRARSARTADSPPAGARPKCGRRPGSKPATRAHRVGGTKP